MIKEYHSEDIPLKSFKKRFSHEDGSDGPPSDGVTLYVSNVESYKALLVMVAASLSGQDVRYVDEPLPGWTYRDQQHGVEIYESMKARGWGSIVASASHKNLGPFWAEYYQLAGALA